MIATIKKVKPMFDGLVTTMNRYDSNTKVRGTDIIDSSKAGSVKEYQTVIAVGPMVRGIEVGDTVFINPKRYAVMKHKPGSLQDGVIKDNPVIGYNFDIVEIDGVEHLYLQSSDIKFVAEVEEFDESPAIYTEQPKILV
nr:MAG TPA: co-chaperonin [Crassvirales sp.]